jgi:hypothetical protein
MNMKKKIMIAILALSMLMTSTMNITGATSLSSNSEADILDITEEEINMLVDFFSVECPSEIESLKNALEKAKIFDTETGEVVGLNLQVLENELNNAAGGNKLKFFRKQFVYCENFNHYEPVRTPYTDPFKPYLKMGIRWSFISVPDDTRRIELYDRYTMDEHKDFRPVGEPIFKAKRVWFHDFSGQYMEYDNPDYYLGGSVEYIWAKGQETDSISKTRPAFVRLLSLFPALQEFLLRLPIFQ